MYAGMLGCALVCTDVCVWGGGGCIGVCRCVGMCLRVCGCTWMVVVSFFMFVLLVSSSI